MLGESHSSAKILNAPERIQKLKEIKDNEKQKGKKKVVKGKKKPSTQVMESKSEEVKEVDNDKAKKQAEQKNLSNRSIESTEPDNETAEKQQKADGSKKTSKIIQTGKRKLGGKVYNYEAEEVEEVVKEEEETSEDSINIKGQKKSNNFS